MRKCGPAFFLQEKAQAGHMSAYAVFCSAHTVSGKAQIGYASALFMEPPDKCLHSGKRKSTKIFVEP